jgi:uncharacterized membrane protein
VQTSRTHWESFKDSVVHLLYVTGYFSVIALVAVAFDLIGHQVLPWIGVTSFVGTGFIWASEALFAVDLILLGVYVSRSMWEKLKGH